MGEHRILHGKRPAPPPLLAVLGLLLAGCAGAPGNNGAGSYPLVSQPRGVVEKEVMEADLTRATHKAADAMLDNLQDYLDPHRPILPANFVNMDDLSQTSSLGRLLARQMASRFTQRGYSITEIKLRNTLYIQQRAGEFMLSRDLEQIQHTHNVQAVLVGSYVVAPSTVFVNAQVVRTSDRRVLASQDYTLPLGSNVRALLGTPRNQELMRPPP